MKMRVSTWGQVSSGLLVSMLAACGGGGGGGYGSMTLTPTVNFSQPAAAATINFGQAMTVAWTSAYSTSCTASVSSTAAGAFTGTQMTSGSVTVVPTAAGSYTYTLSCTGAGGTKAGSVSVTVTPNLLAALAPTGTALTVGSTTDTTLLEGNPYGLTIAPATATAPTAGGVTIAKGDLVVCNFNNGAGVEGNGTTIIGLHPGATPATPYLIAQSADLKGCNALTMLPDDSISAAAWSSNLNPLVSATGTVGAPFAGDTFAQPWGEAFVAAKGTQPAALYVSNAPANNGVVATGGTIDRISLDANNAQTSFTEIVSGFCAGGSPGSIFGPAGLTYDASIDTLYVVDSSSASVIAIAAVSSIPKDGIVVDGQCSATTPTPVPTFSGPSMASAKVIAHGAPLFTPISAALLKNGDLVVGNGDIGVNAPSATTNFLIEISPVLPGGFVGKPVQVETGAQGALFGLAATVNDQGNQIIYFNDDTTNAVMQLGPVSSPSTGINPY
jgi:hypothetical protein